MYEMTPPLSTGLQHTSFLWASIIFRLFSAVISAKRCSSFSRSSYRKEDKHPFCFPHSFPITPTMCILIQCAVKHTCMYITHTHIHTQYQGHIYTHIVTSTAGQFGHLVTLPTLPTSHHTTKGRLRQLGATDCQGWAPTGRESSSG